MKKIKIKSFSKKIPSQIFFTVFAVLIILSAGIILDSYYQDKIWAGVFVGGQSLNGLTKAQATEKLNSEIDNRYGDGILLTYKNKVYRAKLNELGIKIKIEDSVKNAFLIGHQKNFWERVKERWQVLNNKKNITLYFSINENELENYLNENLAELETQPVNANFKFIDNDFKLTDSKEGILIDRKKLKKDLEKNISNLKNEIIILDLKIEKPEVESDETGEAYRQAKNLINSEISLKCNNENWPLESEELISWIKFVPVKDINNPNNKVLGIQADEEKIKNYLSSLAPQINQEPINAQLTIKNNRVDIFSLSYDGLTLMIDKSVEEIKKNIFSYQNYLNKNKDLKKVTVELAVSKIQPEVTTESIDNLGISVLLGKGESNFYGSPKNRRHNIAIGASKFNGVLVGPGEEFSFNKILGKVGPRAGYLPELVIKKNKTVPEYGGGLCQVSTTAFRAALNAGLKITERVPHAYPVRYYNPQGTDATIYPPHPDLRFINDTPAFLLIQTKIKGNILTFEFYGTNDGREVKVKGPYIYDKKRDGSMKAVLYQEIYRNNKLVRKDTFYSRYRSPSLFPH